MKPIASKRQRCTIYTRKSTGHNLDLTFTSLDAQREACEAWSLVRDRFDDGGLSGASLDRPALHCRFPLRFDPGFPLRTEPA
jgi:site-specific DNA recombinase